MPDLGRIFPYKLLAKYPHLTPHDTGVWSLFIDHNPHAFTTVYYDVRVGSGAAPPDTQPDDWTADYQSLTQKRIDAVAIGATGLYIIELKPRAGAIALGQVRVYEDLFHESFPQITDTHPTLICYNTDPDIARLAKSLGVLILHAEERDLVL